jgi:hypothetical protein
VVDEERQPAPRRRRRTPEPAARAPTPNTQRVPARDAQHTPELDSEHTPERDAQHAPERDTQHAPERDTQHTPDRDTQHTPDRVAASEPKPPRARESGKRNGRVGSAGWAARRAASEVADLTGQQPETVIFVERLDDGWQVGVEVVETHRIPDSADILAAYEVRLESDGELVSYRRIQRYSRGQMNRERR